MTVEQQMRDAQAVVKGDKPMVIIEERKAPVTYAKWLNIYQNRVTDDYNGTLAVFVYQQIGDEDPEIIVCLHPDMYETYLHLLATRDCYSRKQYQAAFGTLLGYDINDTEAWYLDPVSMRCECSKCGGTVTRRDRLDHDAWLARTQQRAI